jgi:hypothetical protein
MSTNSLVIKASLFTEWFQPHLIPSVLSPGERDAPLTTRWFMYVPAKLDFSDITDIMALYVFSVCESALHG